MFLEVVVAPVVYLSVGCCFTDMANKLSLLFCSVQGDTSALERGALDFPTELNDYMAEVAPRSRALVGSVPRYHNMPSVYEVIRPFNIAKTQQTRHLQPEPPSVSVRQQVL